MDSFTHNTEYFREIWSRYSNKYEGRKIAANNLAYFFMDLRKPLGFKGMTKRDLKWD